VRAPTDWCVTLAVRLPGLGKVRIVVSCEHESLTGRSAGLVPNRVDWSAAKIIGLYLQRWPTEIVQTRMTTRADRSPGARGAHGPTRPLAVGDEDAIDPPLHQSSAVGTREWGHGRRRLGPRTQLRRHALLGLGHLLACALARLAPHALGQIDLPPADLRPCARREGLTVGLPPGLKGLGPPCAAVGPGACRGAERWRGQDPAAIRPDHRIQGPGRGQARWATGTPRRPPRRGSTTTDIVGRTRGDGAPPARQLTRATMNHAPA
jgi:hypothetical protein